MAESPTQYSISEIPAEVIENQATCMGLPQTMAMAPTHRPRKTTALIVDSLALDADLEAHSGSTTNSHQVTAAQVGAPTTADLSTHTGNATLHRSINGASASATALWSADKIPTKLSGKSVTDQTHTASAITYLDNTVEATTDVAANTAAHHTHSNNTVLDATTASFTTADETKLDGVAAGATANSSDAILKACANHTGTQTASTISDFSTAAGARITAQKAQSTGFGYLGCGQQSSVLTTACNRLN